MADDDIRGLLGSVQDYLSRGGLDEDVRYAVGPHAYEGLSRFAKLFNTMSPGADVAEMKESSEDTMSALRSGDYSGAAASAAMIPATMAMMAVPGTAGGVDDAVDSGLSSIRWYRGTNDPSELSVLRKNKEGTLGGGGVYLTPDPEYASRYAEETIEGTTKKGGFVMPLTARFDKPLIVDLDKTRGYAAEIRVLEELGLSKEKAEAVSEKALEEYGSLTTQASKLAKKQGYDGIILRQDGKIVEALSYRPEDIKSAFGTSTRAEEESMMNEINNLVFEPEPDIQFKNTGGLVTRNPYNRQPKAI